MPTYYFVETIQLNYTIEAETRSEAMRMIFDGLVDPKEEQAMDLKCIGESDESKNP